MSAPYTKLDEPLNECALLCRACLAKSGEMKNMFDWGLANDFSKITNIELLKSSKLSSLLCVPCEGALITCLRFIQQSQNSDFALRSMVEKEQQNNLNESCTAEETVNLPKENTIELDIINENLVLKISAPNMNEKIHLPCPYCQNTFLKQNDLLLHIKRQHRVSKDFLVTVKFYCSVPSCLYNKESGSNKYFQGRKYLNQHYIKVHASKTLQCDQCGVKHATESELNRHSKDGCIAYVCVVCGSVYKTKERLHVHIMRKHPDLHKEYKDRKKQKLLKRTSSIESEIKRLRKDESNDLSCDSPKKTLATQTFNNTNENIKNDVTLPSWYTSNALGSKSENESTKTDEISTQTVFEDILSMKSQASEDESIFFSETVSLSDIQTQTFPLEFGFSRSNKETITSGTQSPDLSMKETQTCFCLYDSPKINFRLFDSVSSSPGSMNFTSTETQTQEHRNTVKSDVMLSFSSAETQTSFEDNL